MEIKQILTALAKAGGSDLHCKAGQPPVFRLKGTLFSTDAPPFSVQELEEMLFSVISPAMKEKFIKERELDFSFEVPEVARFRGNIFYQKGLPGAVFRLIPATVPTLDSLGMPPVLKELIEKEQGLILVTGPTGSGKSTTLAALIDEINTHKAKHIVTVEDPIEFVHQDKLCLVNQREIGFDTLSFSEALRRALRQDPDVILVGEMRDPETISIAMTAAETGHLVFSTLHTNDAKQSIDRIKNSYPPQEQHQVKMQLAQVLEAVISQRLLPKADGSGRLAVQEIMLKTPTIKKLIEDDQIGGIDKVIEESSVYYKMQSLNQALLELWKKDLIKDSDALAVSNNPSDLQLKIKTESFARKEA